MAITSLQHFVTRSVFKAQLSADSLGKRPLTSFVQVGEHFSGNFPYGST